MRNIFWRIIIAVLVYLFVFALLPHVLAFIGLSVDANVIAIIRLCAAGIAVFYILFGPPVRPAP